MGNLLSNDSDEETNQVQNTDQDQTDKIDQENSDNTESSFELLPEEEYEPPKKIELTKETLN